MFGTSWFFQTQILLKKDSTFKYQYFGDLTNQIVYGTYSVTNDTIQLFLEQIPPDTMFSNVDSLSYLVITNARQPVIREKWFYRDGKLWKVDHDGKINHFSRDGAYRERDFYLKKTSYRWREW